MSEQAETDTKIEVSGNKWPDKESFLSNRKSFVNNENNEWRLYIRNLEKADEKFEFNDREFVAAKELLGHFAYGVELVQRRMGYNKDVQILFNDRQTKGFNGDLMSLNNIDDVFIGYDAESGQFVINQDFFKALVQEQVKSDGKIEFYGKMNLTDFMLLVGVHEGAHGAFMEYKGQERLLKDTDIAYGEGRLGHLSANHERRATVWQKAVADRYMPQYSEDLAEMLDKMREAKSRLMSETGIRRWLRKRVGI